MNMSKHRTIKQLKAELITQKPKPRQKFKIVEHDFTNGLSVTDHFIERAHERFGVRDLHDSAKNHDYVTSWALELLKDYDEIEQSGDDALLVKCKQIIIVYSIHGKKCLTCYPMSYNKDTKVYDSLAATIKKKLLKLDDFDSNYVQSVFVDRYYQDGRKYAKELCDLHIELAALYKMQSGSTHHDVFDDKQTKIEQINSVIHEIEAKMNNIKKVVFNLDVVKEGEHANVSGS